MKILHTMYSLRKAAGPSIVCIKICDLLKEMGHDVTIAVVDWEEQDRYPSLHGVPVIPWSSVWADKRSPSPYDLIHIHGMWLFPLHRMARWAVARGIPMVWSPHGSLTLWAMKYKRWKKIIPWYVYQKPDLKKVSCFHVATQAEAVDVRRHGLGQPTVVAPLGVDTPTCIDRLPKDGRRILFLSRVHPTKGLPNLLQAWAQIKGHPVAEGWRMVVAGPDQIGHQAELLRLAQTLGLRAGDCSTSADAERLSAVRAGAQDVTFVGAVYDELKSALHRMADIFVLPTYSENFGLVVPDALSYGLPVITTKGAPWEELETEKCGKWIDIGVEPLTRALKEMMSLSDEERQRMGMHGYDLVNRKYTWHSAGLKIHDAYQGIVRQK